LIDKLADPKRQALILYLGKFWASEVSTKIIASATERD
jgi:hypothetical protein